MPRHTPKGTFAAAARAIPASSGSPSTAGSPLGLPISAETLEALDTAVALAREGGHTVEEIDLPFIGRDFMADFARTVASAVAGTMRGRGACASAARSWATSSAPRGCSARFGEIVSAGEIYAGLQRLHADVAPADRGDRRSMTPC